MVKEMSEMETDTSDSITLEYERLDNRGIPGGHLGYSTLKLSGVDASLRANFFAAYEEMRDWEETTFIKRGSGEEEELVEWNPVVALVYNKGKVVFPLGLKFNEDWMTQGEGEYCGFVDDGWSILQDWKRGKEVPPLKLSKDLDPKEHHYLNRGVVPRVVGEPLLIEATDVEIVFVGLLKQMKLGIQGECPNLKILAQFVNWRNMRATPTYAFYLRVTADGVSKVELGVEGDGRFILNEEGEWEKEKKATHTE
jgi:hypothetical protein